LVQFSLSFHRMISTVVAAEIFETMKTNRPADEVIAERARSIPTGRIGNPAEFGEACAFLCAASSGYIVGQNLLLDGGAFNSTMG